MPRKRDRGGVVADNLTRIIGDEPVATWSKRHKLNQPTIRRIMIGEISPTEATITQIARELDLAPWMLLVPEMNHRKPPVINGMTDAERQLYSKLDQAIAILKTAADTKPGDL